MKTYTFKVKLHFPSDNHPVVVSVVHCPLEILFDSLKEVKQFDDFYKSLKDENNKGAPSMYVTASDYVTENGEYVFNDYIFCEYNAVIESKSLKEFLSHSDYYGFIDVDFSNRKTEQQIIIEEISSLKKVGEEDEV